MKGNIIFNKNINQVIEKKINSTFLDYKKKYKRLRFLIRKSGTEPVVRVLVEGIDQKKVKIVFSKLIKDIGFIINGK